MDIFGKMLLNHQPCWLTKTHWHGGIKKGEIERIYMDLPWIYHDFYGIWWRKWWFCCLFRWCSTQHSWDPNFSNPCHGCFGMASDRTLESWLMFGESSKNGPRFQVSELLSFAHIHILYICVYIYIHTYCWYIYIYILFIYTMVNFHLVVKLLLFFSH